MKKFLLTIAALLAFYIPASATTYYVSASGADTNNGTSKTTTWLHAPGMGGCSNTCASATITAGDSIILKGGDTWHYGNSGLTPFVSTTNNLAWDMHFGGANGNPVYVGTDHTWFTGGSFTRPIMNGDNTITTNTQTCAHDFMTDTVVQLIQGNGANHIRFDDLEWKGFCYDGQGNNASGLIGFDGSDAIVEHMYIHGVTTQAGSSYNWYAITSGNGDAGYGVAGNQCLYNVIDNSDGTWGNYQSYPVGAASLGGIENTCGGVLAFNVFHRISNIGVGAVVAIHDNLYFDDYDPDLAPGFNPNGTHGNIQNQNNNDGVPTAPLRWYNNLVWNVREGVGFWPMLTSTPTPLAYIFNNTIWNCYQQCWFLGSNNGAVLYYYNNTAIQGTNSDGTIGADSGSNLLWKGTVHFSNNHFIGFSPAILSSVYYCQSGSTCTWIDDSPSSEIFQSIAAANAQGYVQGNNFAPTSNTNATVTGGPGVNYTSSCSTFSSDNALCSGVAGVSEQSGEGGLIASSPANPPIVARPGSGGWNSGAYQFGGSTPPPPPTGVVINGGVSISQLPAGVVNTLYSYNFAASQGTPPYTWQQNPIIPGLAIQPTGVFNGIPTLAGTYNPVITVKDSSNPVTTASVSPSLLINPATSTCPVSGEPWQNFSFTSQASSFTVSYDETPSQSGMNGVTALGNTSGTDYANFAVLTRFNPTNTIDARNGGVYTASVNVPYSANLVYHFRLVINLSTHTYDVYVTPPSSSEVQIVAGYSFRTEQVSLNAFSDYGIYSEVGSFSICNFSFSSIQIVSVSMSPISANILTNRTQQFTATVSNATNTGVNWSASAGTITSAGLFTAPNTAQTVTITATSQQDITKSAKATVIVTAPVVATLACPQKSNTATTDVLTCTIGGFSKSQSGTLTWTPNIAGQVPVIVTVTHP